MNGDAQMNNFPIADKPSKGPLLGTIIIVLLIIIGGIYILTSRGKGQLPDTGFGNGDATPSATSPVGASDNQFTTPGATTSPSNDISALEQEASGLESDLQTLDQDATDTE